MKLKIRGNDIELDGEKIARLFDLSTFAKSELEDLFDKANNYQDDLEKSYERGRDENE
tara:strand:+ start:59 stop:232 length:174 start_codon:yes stop_codon:yes gene_type:complete